MSRNVNLITLKKKVETRKMSDLPDPGPLIGHRHELQPLIGQIKVTRSFQQSFKEGS